MALNFSEFSEEYDKNEKKKASRRKKARKDNPGDRNVVGQTHPFNIIGDTGIDGDGYAYEEQPVTEASWANYSAKDERRRAAKEKEHKAQDDRMRYGKKGKDYHDRTQLRPGEVKRWDKELGRWVSNKETGIITNKESK